MKKLIFSVASLAILFASCSDDDDNTTPVVVEGVTEAAVLTGGDYTFCQGDGEDDIVNVTVGDAGVGTNSTFIITDADNNVLGLPPTLANIPNFDDQGEGVCLIWHLNYEGDPETYFEGVTNASELTGDFALSNSITVNRITCVAEAATLVGGPFDFCVDGLVDNIIEDVVGDAGTGNLNSFVVTNVEGWILGLPPVVSGPDFDGAGFGMCYVYHINYEEGLVGLTGPIDGEPTSNIDDLKGDFKLSNFLVVNREDCSPGVVAAVLEAGDTAIDGEYTFSVGDGLSDNVTDLTVGDAGEGETGQIVVTDADGWILGLPPVFNGPDFDGAGVGVCYIRHINYDGEITGLTGPVGGTPTANVNDLEGNFKLSNIIVVNREDSAPSVVAAVLEAGPSAVDGEYTFVVDGIVDNVTDINVMIPGAGDTVRVVVTDTEGTILGLPPTVGDVDFDGAGEGVCYIRYLSHNGDITGLMPSENVNDLEGDFKLSNIIIVNRNL